MGYRRPLRDIVDAEVVLSVEKELDDSLGPIRPVPKQPQVTQRLFRTSEFTLFLAQLVRELDEHLPVPVPLMLRQSEDAGYIVILGRFLLLREVADGMTAC
jgi:hypothetical protein